MIPTALVLAAGLAAGTATAESIQDRALRAMLDSDWARAVELWAEVDGQRAREYLQQARAELQFQRTRSLLDEARAARQKEDWAAADTAYLKALTISPHLKSAHQGREQVTVYIEAYRRLDALGNCRTASTTRSSGPGQRNGLPSSGTNNSVTGRSTRSARNLSRH